MQECVKDAEDKMQREKVRCQEKVSSVEREFNEKEKHLMDKLKREMNTMVQEQMREL